MYHDVIIATTIFTKLKDNPNAIYACIVLWVVVLLIFGSPYLIGENGLLCWIEFRIKDWYLKKTYNKKWGLGKYQKEKKEEPKPMEIERFNAKKARLVEMTEEQKEKEALYRAIDADVNKYEMENHGIPLYDHNAPPVSTVIRGMKSTRGVPHLPEESSDPDDKHVVHKAVMLDLTPEEKDEPEKESSSVEPVELLVEEPEEEPSKSEVEVSEFKDFTGEVIIDQKWVTPDKPKKKYSKATVNEMQAAEKLVSLIAKTSNALPPSDSDFAGKMIGVLRELIPDFVERLPDLLTHKHADLVRLWEMGCNADTALLAKELDVDEDTVIRVLRAHYHLKSK